LSVLPQDEAKTNQYIAYLRQESVTTQNLASLSYWYRNKRLQMHF